MKKTYNYWAATLSFLSVLVLCSLLSSCNGKRSPYNSAGKSREMVMVLPSGAAGDALEAEAKAIFSEPIPYLPQREAEIDAVQLREENFRGIFKSYRHIMIIEVDPSRYTKAQLKITQDVWAKGQQVFMAQAPNAQELKALLLRQKNLIVRRVCQSDIRRDLLDLKQTYNSAFKKQIEEQFPDFTMNIPTDLEWTQAKQDFLWASNLGKGNRGRLDICLYRLPYQDQGVFNAQRLMDIRDSVMQINIPGEYPHSHMATEQRFGAAYRHTTAYGAFRAELRGLWKMEGDAMGGPFVQHIVIGPDRKYLLVAETYVYAPQLDSKKRLLMRGEAALYSLRPRGTELDSRAVFPSRKSKAASKQQAER